MQSHANASSSSSSSSSSLTSSSGANGAQGQQSKFADSEKNANKDKSHQELLARLEMMEQNKRELEQDNQRLRDSLKNSEGAKNKALLQLHQLSLQVTDKKNKLLTTAAQVRMAFEKKASELNDESRRISQKLQDTEQELAAANNHVAQLTDENTALQNAASDSNAVSTLKNENMAVLTNENQALHTQLQQSLDENKKISRELQDAKQAQTAANHHVDQLTHDKNTLTTMYQGLHTSHTDLQQRIQSLPRQPAPPVKTPLWKYALAATGCVLGILAIATGVGAVVGAPLLAFSISVTAGYCIGASGFALIAAGGSYAGLKVLADAHAQRAYDLAVQAPQAAVRALVAKANMPLQVPAYPQPARPQGPALTSVTSTSIFQPPVPLLQHQNLGQAPGSSNGFRKN